MWRSETYVNGSSQIGMCMTKSQADNYFIRIMKTDMRFIRIAYPIFEVCGDKRLHIWPCIWSKLYMQRQ